MKEAHSNGNNTLRGYCKWFADEQGYGFIVDKATGKEFFVHHKNIVMTGRRLLFAQEEVTFTIGADENGRQQAMNVVRLPKSA